LFRLCVSASFTVIAAKALSGLIQIAAVGHPQFRHPIPYIMVVVMIGTAVIQVKYLNQAMKSFDSTVVVPTNFVFFTISAILAGIQKQKQKRNVYLGDKLIIQKQRVFEICC
jgi:hypothetical protein